MPRMDLHFSSRFFRKGHSTVLLFSLVLFLFVLHPLLVEHRLLLTLLRGAFMVVLFSACYAVATSPRTFWLTVALALITAAFSWTGQLAHQPLFVALSSVSSILFFLCVAMLLLRRVLDSTTVTLDKIFGAICVYMIFGLMWSEIFGLIHDVNPDAFIFSDRLRTELSSSRPGVPASVFIYYSFVTLSTLGYGDVSPASTGARAMASLEAIVGPLYLAILIARLVSQMDTKAPPVRS